MIVAIDGRPMRDGNEMIRLIHASGDRTLAIVVERGGTRFLVHVPTKYDPQQRVWVTGFIPVVTRTRLDPVRAVGWGVLTTGRDRRRVSERRCGTWPCPTSCWASSAAP